MNRVVHTLNLAGASMIRNRRETTIWFRRVKGSGC
jgi:hypothetical protein